jgi:hypothetical protein
MMKKGAGLVGVAGVLAWMRLTTGCVGDGDGATSVGTAVEREDSDGWKIIAVGDFNRDGLGDMLWSDPGTNQIAVSLMDGARLLARGPGIAGPSGDGWVAVTGADFNADGMCDVIWFNARTNRMAVWLMNGAQVLAAGPEIPGPSGQGWTAVNAVDTNLDGMADVVWQSAAGQMAIWLMNGTRLLATGPSIPGPDTADP